MGADQPHHTRRDDDGQQAIQRREGTRTVVEFSSVRRFRGSALPRDVLGGRLVHLHGDHSVG